MSISQAPDPGYSPSLTPMPTDVPAPSDSVGSSDSAGGNVGLIVGVVVGALLLALAVTGVTVLMIVLIRARKGSKQRMYDVPQTCENPGLANPVYSGL